MRCLCCLEPDISLSQSSAVFPQKVVVFVSRSLHPPHYCSTPSSVNTAPWSSPRVQHCFSGFALCGLFTLFPFFLSFPVPLFPCFYSPTLVVHGFLHSSTGVGMDRSPSLRTTTDRPDRRSSSCSSSAFGSDLDEFMSKSPSPINEKKDDTLKSWHSGTNSPSRLGTPPKRASFATPLSVSTTFHPPPHGGDPPAISSSAPRRKSPSHREEVKREEPCVIKPCKDAAAQLQKTRQMLQRLDSHNDEMEGALTGLRARVDTYRSLVKNSLSKAVNGLRGDLRVLRESAQFLLHDFGVDMEQCEKIITRRIMRDVGGSLPESVSKDIRAGKGGKVSPSRAALQQTNERFGEQPSASTGLRELELQEDLIEAEQRCCALENKLKQQRETCE
ncbi:unnamed protein product, partial [Trypanosoma congolense IL3000]